MITSSNRSKSHCRQIAWPAAREVTSVGGRERSCNEQEICNLTRNIVYGHFVNWWIIQGSVLSVGWGRCWASRARTDGSGFVYSSRLVKGAQNYSVALGQCFASRRFVNALPRNTWRKEQQKQNDVKCTARVESTRQVGRLLGRWQNESQITA